MCCGAGASASWQAHHGQEGLTGVHDMMYSAESSTYVLSIEEARSRAGTAQGTG